MRLHELGTFIAVVLFGAALLVGGFEVGQENPEANNILEVVQD